MNGSRYRVCPAALFIICLVSLTAPARSLPQGATSPGAAAATVRSFFRFHLARDMSFTRENVVRRRRWLTPELYRLLLDEYHREELESAKHPDEVVYMAGDPFTSTQEHPNSFRVGRPLIRGSRATVPVVFFLDGQVLRKARIEVSRRGRVWLIHNIMTGDDDDLLKLLRGRARKNSKVK